MVTPQTPNRNLPAILPREVERTGYQLLAALDRLGFVHKNGDGSIFTICFDDVALFGSVAGYSIDLERLWHFRAGDLACARTLQHLSSVLKKPITADTSRGLYFYVRLRPAPPPPRLPARVALDLSSRPAGALQVPVGVSLTGPLWRELSQLGHALIIGASGSGKSTWLHCALASLLTAAGPDSLQVVLIDPKQIELAAWAKAPHARGPVAWDVAGATQALGELADEMDARGGLIASVGARDLAGYNRRADSPLPYVLGIMDEALDLTLQAGNRSELATLLKRIASKGRATGVYLWLAATHDTANILPRVVSLNLATRLCFRVQDAAAANLAGCPGAQNIPRDKPGRMLARLEGEPVEVQAYWLDDEALEQIVRAWHALAVGNWSCLVQ